MFTRIPAPQAPANQQLYPGNTSWQPRLSGRRGKPRRQEERPAGSFVDSSSGGTPSARPEGHCEEGRRGEVPKGLSFFVILCLILFVACMLTVSSYGPHSSAAGACLLQARTSSRALGKPLWLGFRRAPACNKLSHGNLCLNKRDQAEVVVIRAGDSWRQLPLLHCYYHLHLVFYFTVARLSFYGLLPLAGILNYRLHLFTCQSNVA